MQQVQAILDARQAIRNLAEVAPAELLLAMEVERAVIGGHQLQIVLEQATPQVVPVVLRTEWRRANELGALESVAQVIKGKEEVLRARFGKDG